LKTRAGNRATCDTGQKAALLIGASVLEAQIEKLFPRFGQHASGVFQAGRVSGRAFAGSCLCHAASDMGLGALQGSGIARGRFSKVVSCTAISKREFFHAASQKLAGGIRQTLSTLQAVHVILSA